MMTPVRVKAMDRRNAAIHEAGHFIIGRHLGMARNYAVIRPMPDAKPPYDKTWVGQHSSLTAELEHLSEHDRIMISVAGFAAERCWSTISKPNEEQCWVEEDLSDPAAMSPTDWAGTGCEPGQATQDLVDLCEETERLLAGELLVQLLATARKLMREHSSG